MGLCYWSLQDKIAGLGFPRSGRPLAITGTEQGPGQGWGSRAEQTGVQGAGKWAVELVHTTHWQDRSRQADSAAGSGSKAPVTEQGRITAGGPCLLEKGRTLSPY